MLQQTTGHPVLPTARTVQSTEESRTERGCTIASEYEHPSMLYVGLFALKCKLRRAEKSNLVAEFFLDDPQVISETGDDERGQDLPGRIEDEVAGG